MIQVCTWVHNKQDRLTQWVHKKHCKVSKLLMFAAIGSVEHVICERLQRDLNTVLLFWHLKLNMACFINNWDWEAFMQVNKSDHNTFGLFIDTIPKVVKCAKINKSTNVKRIVRKYYMNGIVLIYWRFITCFVLFFLLDFL